MGYISPPKELRPGSSVIAYFRDSGGGKQELSIPEQRNVIVEYCKKYDFNLVEIFEDPARSARSTKKRYEFDRMIELCKIEGFADGLLLWNFARFARNYNDSSRFKGELRSRGMIVHSLTDEVGEGSLKPVLESMKDLQNEQQSVTTSDDTKRGLAERTMAGNVPGGGTPRGYLAVREVDSYHRDGSPRIGTKLIEDPELGPLATMAFNLKKEHKSHSEIMKAPCGILYKSESSWVSFFENPTYLGIGKCGETMVTEHHPPLVDVDTWIEVQRIKEKAKKRLAGNPLHPKRYNSPSLLSGLSICIHCGTPIIREVSGSKSTKSGKWISYLCGKKRNSGDWHACEGRQIQSANADAAIADVVLSRLLTENFTADLLDQIGKELSDNTEINHQENAARKALSSCEKRIKNLLDAIESGNSSTAKERLKERENERAGLQFQLTIIESQQKARKLNVSPEALNLVLEVWSGNIESARDKNDIRSLQSLLRIITSKIELGYGTVRLWYAYPVESFTENKTQLIFAPVQDRQSVKV